MKKLTDGRCAIS